MSGPAVVTADPQIVVVGTLSTDCVADRPMQELLRRRDNAHGATLRPGTERLIGRDIAHHLMQLARGGGSRLVAGGVGYRVAEALTGLRLGLRVGFVGVLGSDAADATLARMHTAGIDHRHVVAHPRHPAGFTVYVASPGGYTVLVYPGANLTIDDYLLLAHDDLVGYLRRAPVVYLAPLPGRYTAARLTGLLTAVKAANPRGVVVLDPGLGGIQDRAATRRLLHLADLVICDHHRLGRLSGLAAGHAYDVMAGRVLRQMSGGATLVLRQVSQVLTWQHGPPGSHGASSPTGVAPDQIVETFGLDEAVAVGLLASLARTGTMTGAARQLAAAMLRYRLTHTAREPGDLAAVAHQFPHPRGPGGDPGRPPRPAGPWHHPFPRPEHP